MTASFSSSRAVIIPAMASPLSTAGSGVERESAVVSWLGANFELAPLHVSVTQMDAYRRYVAAVGMHGLQNVVSPTVFDRCFRVAFPKVAGEQRSTSQEPSGDVVYTGIVQRAVSLPFSLTIGKQ